MGNYVRVGFLFFSFFALFAEVSWLQIVYSCLSFVPPKSVSEQLPPRMELSAFAAVP